MNQFTQYHHKYHLARVEAARAGDPIPCAHEGCSNPCYVSPSGHSSNAYCLPCIRASVYRTRMERALSKVKSG